MRYLGRTGYAVVYRDLARPCMPNGDSCTPPAVDAAEDSSRFPFPPLILPCWCHRAIGSHIDANSLASRCWCRHSADGMVLSLGPAALQCSILQSRESRSCAASACGGRKPQEVSPSVCPISRSLVTAQFIQFNLPHHPATLAALNGPPEAPEANTLLVAT